MKQKKIGVGVIGLGMASLPHAKSLLDLASRIDVFGVYSPSLERRRQFADKFGFPTVESVEALVNDKRISVVLLLTPPNARLELVEMLASSGKHILMEKPIERTLSAATKLVEICEQNGVRLGLVFQHRFRDASIALKEQLVAGKLGKVAVAQICVPWWRDQDYYDVPGRGSYERDGGGVLISQAIHTLDLALDLLGPVSTVAAIAGTTPFHQMESEDFVSAGLRFDSGAFGSLVATTASYPGFSESITLHGDLGTAVLQGGELTITSRDGQTTHVGESAGSGGGSDPMDFPHHWHRRLIESFLDLCDTETDTLGATADHRAGWLTDAGSVDLATVSTPVSVSGRDGLMVHQLIDALLKASDAGAHVSVQPN